MSVNNVLLTSGNAEEFEPFVGDGIEINFTTLDAGGINKLVEGPIWAFLDWVMDDISGLEMCRRLRADPRTTNAHITMILETDDWCDRKRAISAGADDYIIGPISREAVLDRVLAISGDPLNRPPMNRFERGPLMLDVDGMQAYWNGKPIIIGTSGLRLLRLFAENANRVLSREELIEGLGKHVANIDRRTVDVWVGRLRRAIKAAGGGHPLRTARSIGYVLDLP
ncbi:MAG TPA: DNA-binding response regulator [Erythrobacter sp.]|nr:DNA-binding response regulator [Erythrobacter sp.]